MISAQRNPEAKREFGKEVQREQLDIAIDMFFQVEAIARMSAYIVDNMPYGDQRLIDEMLAALGRSSEIVMAMTGQAIELVDGVRASMMRVA